MRGALVRAAAAHEDEVLRHGARPELADASLETDGRDVMLAAAIRAPADLDVAGRHQIDEIGTAAQMLGQGTPQTARLCHRQPAALGAGTADDVAQPAGVRSAETGGSEPLIERLD